MAGHEGQGQMRHLPELSEVQEGQGKMQHLPELSEVHEGQGQMRHLSGLSEVHEGQGQMQHLPELSEVHEGQGQMRHLSGLSEGQEIIPECEVVLDGESDPLDTRYSQCRKNPGHPNFIPASQFTMDHIPTHLRTQENMDLIQRKIARTVRIRVSYTSLRRPDFFWDSETPYPYAKYKGSKRVGRYGTGGIHRLLSPDPVKDKPCPCHLCAASGDPERQYWLITVRTATHVVYDDSEAEKATFDCFYDSPDSKDSIKTLYGVCIDGSNTSQDKMYKSDHVEIVCVTHDNDIMKRLHSRFAFAETMQVPHLFTSELPPEGVIVSHPHGCSKRVTFGSVHHVTVPVKPTFDTSTPISFTRGTECRWNSLLCEADENPTLFFNFLQDAAAATRSVTNTNTIQESCETKVVEASKENTSSGACSSDYNSEASQSHSAQGGEIVFVNERKENARLKRIEELCNGFFDDLIILTQRFYPADEFHYSSHSRPIEEIFNVITKMVDEIGSSGDQLVSAMCKVTERVLPLHNTMTQTSKSVNGNEFDMTDVTQNRQRVVTLMSKMLKALDVDADKADQALNLAKEVCFKMMRNQTMPRNELTGVGLVELLIKLLNDIMGEKGEEWPWYAQIRNMLECAGYREVMEQVNKLFLNNSPKRKNIIPGASVEVSHGVTFTLPPEAQYAMRYRKDSPGWFVLPPGTKLTDSQGQVMSLPEEAEFRNATFHPKHSFISYNIDTCPGSSGAAVHSSLLGNNLMTHFSHSGSGTHSNLSAVQENVGFPVLGRVFQDISRVFHYLSDLIEDEKYNSITDKSIENEGGKNVPQQLADIDLD